MHLLMLTLWTLGAQWSNLLKVEKFELLACQISTTNRYQVIFYCYGKGRKYQMSEKLINFKMERVCKEGSIKPAVLQVERNPRFTQVIKLNSHAGGVRYV